jgi:predicted Zn-dependent protease
VAEVALAKGDVPGAVQALQRLGEDSSRSGLLLRARLALADGRPGLLGDSAQALQTWLAEQRDDASAWQLLGQTAERQGQPLRAVRAEAEVQAALGNLGGAIDRLRAGQQLARRGGEGTDFIEASVIDARLRQLMAQRRQLMAEQNEGRRGPRDDAPE